MQRIQSGERTAILLESPEDAIYCHHKGKLHSKVQLPPEVENIMSQRGTTFSKDSSNIMTVHCEREILEFLSHDHSELKGDLLVLSSMKGEGRPLWCQANMLALQDFVHAYIVLSQQERLERQDWNACRILTARFLKAVTGDTNAKKGLKALFRNRFQGKALTIEELEKMEAAKLARQANLENRGSFKFQMSAGISSNMRRLGSL